MLEVKIEALTIAIDRLTAQLQAQQPTAQQPAPVEPKAKQKKPHLRMEKSLSIEPTPQQPPTKETLRDLFIEKTRNDTENKAKIKELLKLYGAAKINDLKDGDLAEIYQEAQAL